MTTKQPPAQKHLDKAREIVDAWYETCRGENVIDRIAAALAETEAAALAARLITPDDLLSRDREITDFSEDATYAYLDGYNDCLETIRKNTKFTHESAPEIDNKEKCHCGNPAIVKTTHKSGDITYECEEHDAGSGEDKG